MIMITEIIKCILIYISTACFLYLTPSIFLSWLFKLQHNKTKKIIWPKRKKRIFTKSNGSKRSKKKLKTKNNNIRYLKIDSENEIENVKILLRNLYLNNLNINFIN